MTDKGFASNCVKDEDVQRNNEPTQVPIYSTSSYTFDSMSEGVDIFKDEQPGHVYSRYGNPQVDAVGDKIGRLELGESFDQHLTVLTSSGMAAIHCLLNTLLSPGDAILTQPDLYGGTTDLLNDVFKPLGIECLTSSFDSMERLSEKIEEHSKIKMIYFETPTNPLLSIASLKDITAVAQEHSLITVCDNTFATPCLQRPFDYDIDYVVHSTTKYLNGHGTAIGGIVIGQNPEMMHEVEHRKRLMGCQANPFDSWLLNQGLKTLPLRMKKHCQNAAAIAEFLSAHGAITKVYYPGMESHPGHETAGAQMKDYGGILSFVVDGSFEDALEVCDRLEFIRRAPTLGDVESLVLHPASMSHRNMPSVKKAKYGISDALIRLSAGIEDVEDIKLDLQRALDHLK